DSSGAGNDFVQVFSHWTRTDLGRIVLTGSALMAADTDPFELIRKVFAYSDNNEKRSLVLGLYWLLEDERLGGFLEDVQRVNALDIFTALALDNPLPARYYADAPFNQLVLKSLFQNLPIDRIVGLQERRNAELVRMCDDYLHERRLAGREIPASLWLALSCKDLSEETTLAWQSALMSASDDQRYYAAKALQYCRERGEKLPVALTEVLAEQSTRERHPAIKLLVQDMQS
ncbi:MAG: EboA domain-containing protein, partial [Gammaproteobacteria bacterium]|nr:EboA domain-containing protein [Gammaproteobacteria bacterium]